VAYVMESKYGYTLPRWLQIEFSRVVQKEAEDSGLEVSPERIFQLFQQKYLTPATPLTLSGFSIEKSDKERVKAEIELDGKRFNVVGSGNGMLSAFIDAMQSSFGLQLQILEYGEHALSPSANAEAVTYIQLKHEGERFTGIAIDKDIVTSSVNALLNAVSQVLSRQRQQAA